MTMDETQNIPPELKEAVAAVEKEAGKAVDFVLPPFGPSGLPDQPARWSVIGPGGSLPLGDLQARLKMLADAWVEIYEDGPLRIRFDLEGRRAHVKETQGTPTREW
jgi:hypothetical protein